MNIQAMKPAKLDLEKKSHRDKLDLYLNSPEYVAEEKVDGCHYFCQAGSFLSIKGVDKTDNFPHLVEAFLKAGLGQAILDGEIYYPDGNKSFGATEITGCKGEEAVRRQEQEYGWIHYVIFDILRDPSGKSLALLPWYRRREILEEVGMEIMKATEHAKVIPVVRSRKQKFLDRTLNAGKEGVVFKHVNGVYVMGKRPMDNWIKYKAEDTDDVIIMGFDDPERVYTGKDVENWPYWEGDVPVTKHYHKGQIGSVVFGKYDGRGELVYLGSCTGLSDKQREEFTNDQDKYIGQVMEIKYMEKTRDGRYRHPNFVRIHPGKRPKECVIEEGEVAKVAGD